MIIYNSNVYYYEVVFLKINELFCLEHTLAKEYLSSFTYGWEALSGISQMIIELSESLSEEYTELWDKVWVHKSVKLSDTAHIKGPCIIGRDTEIRHGAFIRGSVLIGENCVIGNSTEVKNSILFDKVQVPHFNYVGDSILGYKAHLGAGAITSNVKSDKTLITVKGIYEINTNLRKFGALVGDNTEIGCNTVLNPGTVIGKSCTVYPLSNVRGVIPDSYIYKSRENIIRKE